MTDRVPAAWIAVDWGTSNLRGWAMSADNSVLATRKTARGMQTLAKTAFEDALRELAAGWIDGPVQVVACGMVGSRQGWVEAPYVAVPCAPLSGRFAQAPTTSPELRVAVIPGIRQDTPADVMRGEETQIAGFLALNPGWDGIICLPGTHAKWAHVSAGEVVSFQTYMTGELYALLSGQSVLRHSVDADGDDDAAFDAGMAEGLARPERLAARLFAIRAESLLAGLAPAAAGARLSGLLIGAELAAARPYWLGQQVAVIGEGALARRYVRALAQQGVPATQANAERVTLAGLTAAYRLLKG